MPAERFYHPQPFLEGSSITLEEQEFHHLIHVMRARQGDDIELVNGQGQLAKACIDAIEKKRASLTLSQVETFPPSTTQLILAQAVPRLNRLEFILEKSTELGATEIWLFPGAHSERNNFSENQLERLNTILIAAMKQCGRFYLPKLVLMPPIKKWSQVPSSAFYGDTSPLAPSLAASWNLSGNKQSAFICIGPESGFNAEEESALKNLGVLGVKLHPNILRTDTAAITALAILSHSLFS